MSGFVPIVVIGIVSVVFIFMMIWASRYTKIGPNEVLVISGRKRIITDPDGTRRRVGYRIVKGGGTFVLPVIERVDRLSLEVITLDVNTPEVYTAPGVPVEVDGVAQIKVKGDDVSIATASEQFLSKSRDDLLNIALQTVEGHLRAILGTMTVEDIYRNRDEFAQKVQEVAASDMANMGLQIVSFTLRDIRDSHGYLEALGKPRTAQVKRDAIVAQAEADRDANIKSAAANQAGEIAKYEAQTKIAESQRDYEMKKAEYDASVNQKKAESDLAYDLQKFKTEQLVKKEEIQVSIIEKDRLIEVQEKETIRKERELAATIRKPADAEQYKIQALAEAEKVRLELEAKGQAEATRAKGLAEAEAAKAKGAAQAEVIKLQGLAEAEAMNKKAQSWKNYNEAAITQMFIDALPKIAQAISEPLTKTEKIVVVNTGNDSAGTSKVTKDIANIIAQLPPIIESLSGINLEDLLKRIPSTGVKKSSESAKIMSDTGTEPLQDVTG